MISLSCGKNKDYLLKYIEGTISEKELLELSEHIRNCDECFEEFSAYSQIMGENDVLNDNFIGQQEIEHEEVENTDFEFSIMKKITGIDFKTEKLLIYIVGILSLIVAVVTFFECYSNNVLFDKELIDNMLRNSPTFIDKVASLVGFMVNSIIQFTSEFVKIMKPFSVFVMIYTAVWRIILIYLNRGEKNV